MNRILSFFIALAFFSANAQLVRPCGTEQLYTSSTPGNQLNSICFATNDTVWAVGANSTILKSTDAGVTWKLQPKLSFYGFNSVWFTSRDTGYIAGDASSYGVMLKTVDGGENWMTQYYGTLSYNMSFSLWFSKNSNTGYVGQSSRVAKTTNGGLNWQVKSCGTGGVVDLHFVNKDTGFAVNGAYIYKTQNAGNTWVQVYYNASVNFDAVNFVNKDTGYVGSLGGELYRTINGGATWTMQMDINKVIRDIDFINKDTGYISTSGGIGYGYVMKTYDRGTTWTGNLFYLNNQDFDLRSMAVNTNGRWLAVSKYGDIVSSDDQGVTWVNRKVTLLPAGPCLTKSNFNKFYFGSSSGKIYSTANSGSSFSNVTVSTNTAAVISQIAWPHKDTGYAYGQASSVYFFRRTFNGGVTWQNVPAYGTSQLPTTLSNILFPTKDKGYLSFYNWVYYTNDAGTNWTKVLSGDTNAVRDLYVLNKDTVFACGNNGKVSVSTNGGVSWVLKPSGITGHLMNIYFLNKLKGFVATTTGKVYMTVNGGTNWTQQASYSNYVTDIQFVNSKVGYLNTYGPSYTSTVEKTINGGLTWKTWDYCYLYNTLGYVRAIDEDTVWATAAGNLIKLYDRYPEPAGYNFSFCDSGIVNLNIPPINQYPYNWYYDKDGNNFAFRGNNFTSNLLSQSDTLFYAIADSLYNCESRKSPVYITITPTPSKPGLNYKTDTTLCFGEILNLQPTSVHQVVNWNNSSTAGSITVNQSGYYYATVSDNGCTSAASDSVHVIINPQLPQPLIFVTAGQDSLFSDQQGYYYQWYLNGALLQDTTRYIPLTGVGYYTNSITDSLGCESVLSTSYYYNTVGLKHNSSAISQVSPNPNNGKDLSFSSDQEITKIEIYSSTGKLVLLKELGCRQCNIDINLDNGYYYITIITNNARSSKSFVVNGH
ncbi:MAG: hypothetical protein K0S26_1012 [Bacteroidota bacterium]|jgi:photosystem II stability/assembly factor-like uncharacterized protein|nr:hypothetical protein [Bacteroidota bacterium]